MSPAAGHVSVRMYDVGFGDCFLLTFPAPDRPRKVVVDCGHHTAGPPKVRKFEKVVAQLLQDVREDGIPRVDVVVATHRHRDHVLGFEHPGWADVHVDEVWMPWTEHPTDPEARSIRNVQSKKARALSQALTLSGARDEDAQKARAILDNTLTNAQAMATLHAGFTGVRRRRFLPTKARAAAGTRLRPAVLPGVAVHVLGPSRDRDTIKDMDPPAGQSFLRLAMAGSEGDGGAPALDERWSLSPRGRRFDRWYEATARKAAKVDFDPSAPLRPSDPQFEARWFRSVGLGPGDIRRIERYGEEQPLAVAVALEEAVNGTSLMLAFELGRAVLLFPGDAQWGTWKRAVETPAARAVLERTTFLKIGHHGSHNASPKIFVDGPLGEPFRLAMVSTRETKVFRKIPRVPLLDHLRTKPGTPVVARSDEAAAPAPFVRVSDVCIEARIPV